MASGLSCSFCRRSEQRVEKLVAGPGVYICDACVAIAARIMEDASSPPPRVPLWRRLLVRARELLGGLRHRSLVGQATGAHAG